jgi:hypothetical protein
LKVGLREGTYEGVNARWLRWIDGNGAPLPTTEEEADAERSRADAERSRADAAERRLAALEAKLRGG